MLTIIIEAQPSKKIICFFPPVLMAAASIVLNRTKQVRVGFIEENCGPDTVACFYVTIS